MKLLRGTLQPSGYRVSCLVDPEGLDLLRFEDTSEIPEGAAGESAEVAIPIENGQPPVVIIISLHSNGDIRLLSSEEAFLALSPFDTEDVLS